MAICEVNRFSLHFAAILKENRWLKRMAVYKTGFVWALFGCCEAWANQRGPDVHFTSVLLVTSFFTRTAVLKSVNNHGVASFGTMSKEKKAT